MITRDKVIYRLKPDVRLATVRSFLGSTVEIDVEYGGNIFTHRGVVIGACRVSYTSHGSQVLLLDGERRPEAYPLTLIRSIREVPSS